MLNDQLASWRVSLALLPLGITIEGAEMFLHFSALSDVLTAMHDIPIERREVTRDRLKYFARRDFPLSSQQRGKAKLGLDDVLKLVFVFELLETGMPPLRSLRLATTDWPVISRHFAEAWQSESSDVELLIAPSALAEIAATEDLRDVPLSEVIGDRTGSINRRVTISIDIGKVMTALATALSAESKPKSLSTFTGDDFARAMDQYSAAVLDRDA